jgi:hypothetical protein
MTIAAGGEVPPDVETELGERFELVADRSDRISLRLGRRK